MKKNKARFLTHAAAIAALYAVLTYLQYFLWPESTSMAVQVRLSEALCVLAFFTPAAIPGLTVGCLLFNLVNVGALPFDWLVGTLATYLACQIMWCARNVTVKGYPLLGMLMPAVTNAIFVGWELTYVIGDAFWINAGLVALGEVIALLVVGTVVYCTIRHRHLDEKLFA